MRLLNAVAGSSARRSVRLRRLLVLGVVVAVPALAGFQVVTKQAAGRQDTTKATARAPAGGRGTSQTPRGVPQQDPTALSVLYPPDSTAKICAQVDSTAGGAQLRALMDSLKWVVGCIPMFTDDQRLFTRSKEFGPLAHILPAPVTA